jgi:hypothetical protein
LNQPGGIAKEGPCEYPHTNKEKRVNGKNSKEIIIDKIGFLSDTWKNLKEGSCKQNLKKVLLLTKFFVE